MTRDPNFDTALEYLWQALGEMQRLKSLLGHVQHAFEHDIPSGRLHPIFEEIVAAHGLRDSDGTATAAVCEDIPAPQDCQARAESIAPNTNHPRST
jgi:hypothetical protein